MGKASHEHANHPRRTTPRKPTTPTNGLEERRRETTRKAYRDRWGKGRGRGVHLLGKAPNRLKNKDNQGNGRMDKTSLILEPEEKRRRKRNEKIGLGINKVSIEDEDWMSAKSRHSNLLKDALRGQTPNDEPSELWSPLPDQGWRPCGECTRSSGKPEKSSGYLQIFLDGVAKILNATLVIPLLEVNPVWQDSSSFEEFFDVDHFIDVLKDDISIVKELPYEFSWSTREFYASTIRETRVKTAPVHASDQWYTDNVLPILQRYEKYFLVVASLHVKS
ncbi:hypothetical protein KSS87_009427 [Heliosperma pusillum]|nr:hypothetical protein KSS87_009427 [Heliosperma pusillum]